MCSMLFRCISIHVRRGSERFAYYCRRIAVLRTICNTPFTRYNRLSNRIDNRLDVSLYDATGCPTGCIVEQPVAQPV